MTIPAGVEIIDCMMGIPERENRSDWYAAFRPLIRDRQSLEEFVMPAQYMFKDIPELEAVDDFLTWTLAQMDRHGIAKALVAWRGSETCHRVLERCRDRFLFDLPCNPNAGLDEVRRIRRVHAEVGLSSISVFPAGTYPQVAINHKYMFPLYTVAAELGLPSIPFETQKVEHLDEICWFFPELTVVMRHGGEPWEDLAVKLMLKYPNLYYATSAFAPKHYPKSIVDFANTRGGDKILYAGYFPMGLSLDRIFRELPEVPFRDEVWRKFLSGNARKVYRIAD
jgi:uncharacterized protein